MTITIRRDAEISDVDGGWFRARWHFSFDTYHDPAYLRFGSLRVFNDDRLVPAFRWDEGRSTVRAVAGIDVAYPIFPQAYIRARLRTAASVNDVDLLTDEESWGYGAEVGPRHPRR